jgi:acyl-CoA synthetase (AMP-forming)/AMP-acid ligase II
MTIRAVDLVTRRALPAGEIGELSVRGYVVGVPDQSKGEVVAAAIELRAGAIADTVSIVAFCRERLASYKVPVRLAIRSAAEFPRTPTGKIHKPRLRQELAAAPRHDEGAAIAASLVPDRSG